MFTEEELNIKRQNFEMTKHYFNIMSKFINRELVGINPIDQQFFLTSLITSKFVLYKEDVWKKNKRTKTISTMFPRKILDDVIFKGELTQPKLSMQYKKKKVKYKFDKIDIREIEHGKENDSVWIIDNIRDSIAHGHFYLDNDNRKIIINNDFDTRKLKCTIDYEAFSLFDGLIDFERIGGYTDKNLFTIPIIGSYKGKTKEKVFKNEYQLKTFLKTGIIPIYYEVEEINENDIEKRYEDLIGFYNFFADLSDKLFLSKQKNVPYQNVTKRADEYIKENLSNYKIKLHCEELDDQFVKKIIHRVNEINEFYNYTFEQQINIINSLLTGLIVNNESSIERGMQHLTDLVTNSFANSLTKNSDYNNLYKSWIFTYQHSFVEEQKLANLFILGINNFVNNKESIYDKYFEDYNEFDISNFDYQDYSGYDRLISKLKVLNNDLKNLNNSLTKANESKNRLNINLSKAPEDKKTIISNNINNIDILINDLNAKINNLIIEIKNISNQLSSAKIDSNGHYINNNNQNFFSHLRNAFAHNHIRYADDRLVYNRKIILEDFDDDKNLTFKCVCRYYDLVKLFNDELFLEALSQDRSLKKRKI